MTDKSCFFGLVLVDLKHHKVKSFTGKFASIVRFAGA